MTYRIYEIIRRGAVSGDEIGKALNISRAAVNKHIKKLKNEGVIIESKSGVGYQWIKDSKVNEYALRYLLNELKINIPVYFKETESTNKDAKVLSMKEEGDFLVVAPHQTAGRGRLNRNFASSEGGAYFTLVLSNTNFPAATVMRTVIIAGLSVLNMLKDYGIESVLKWPNDVYVGGKKVTGILMEVIICGEIADKIIIGIGINVENKIPDDLTVADNLLNLTGQAPDIAEIIVRTVNNLFNYVSKLKDGKWPEIKEKYRSNCMTIGRLVKFQGKEGIGQGITDEGFLIIKTEEKENTVISGDVEICRISS